MNLEDAGFSRDSINALDDFISDFEQNDFSGMVVVKERSAGKSFPFLGIRFDEYDLCGYSEYPQAKLSFAVGICWSEPVGRNGFAICHFYENTKLLGHSSSETTDIYTHITLKTKKKLFSPLDFLDLGENTDSEEPDV